MVLLLSGAHSIKAVCQMPVSGYTVQDRQRLLIYANDMSPDLQGQKNQLLKPRLPFRCPYRFFLIPKYFPIQVKQEPLNDLMLHMERTCPNSFLIISHQHIKRYLL